MPQFQIEKVAFSHREEALHSHDYCELLYFSSGSADIHYEHGPLHAACHQMALISPHTPHYVTGEDAAQGYICHLPFLPKDIPVNQIIEDLPEHEMEALFEIMNTLYHQNEIIYSNTIFNQFLLLLRDIASHSHRSVAPPEVAKIINLIDANYTDPSFSIGFAFSSQHLSGDYLRILFKRTTGQSPQGYLIARRIQHACSLLALTGHSGAAIKEIAYQSGFSDPLYFSKSFRKQMNMTPSEYRQAHGYSKYESAERE